MKRTLKPGATIGILGGGQLARMMALAAAPLGYHVHIYTPETDDPACEVSTRSMVADWDNEKALEGFASAVDVVTLEFENIPEASVEIITRHAPLFPGALALATAQNRFKEKSFINQLGIETAPWREVSSEAELIQAIQALGLPAILKTCRFGYDGKGQIPLSQNADVANAWALLGSMPCILEGRVDFEREISVVLARGQDGEIAAYPAVENHHRDGILRETQAPANIPPVLADEALHIATEIANALDYVGVLAVELFVTRDGALLVNEIAPRPHNSGHWTIDACTASQFEQQIRAVCGLPLGSPYRYYDAVMKNLIGDIDDWETYLGQNDAHLHLYGKSESRPGRKMGHVTRLYPIR